MSDFISSVKGMNDVVPKDISSWQQVESVLKNVTGQFAFQEIRFPVVEKTELFKRSVGDLTDIVQKEMYSFEDKHNGDLLTLRPEGTAPCVRACLQNNLLHNQVQRLWYLGPLFRHERPQKGRYRQFHQFGVEAFGYDGIGIELETLSMNKKFWQSLGIDDAVELQINTIGTFEERQTYQAALRDYLSGFKQELDDDSLSRLEKNSLRILDSKNPVIQEILERAPKLHDFLSESALRRFKSLCLGLDKLHIDYDINPKLVRGLDYYSHTVFEWVTDALGAQGTLSAGGRYDGLINQLGGKPCSAVGFAVGVERLVLMFETLSLKNEVASCDVYVAIDKAVNIGDAITMIDGIRNSIPNLRVLTDLAASSLKSQLKRANASHAQYAIVLTKDEFESEKKMQLKGLQGQFDSQYLTMNETLKQLSMAFN